MRNLLSLLDLPLPLQDAVDQGRLTQRIGSLLLRAEEGWQERFLGALPDAAALAQCVQELSAAAKMSPVDDEGQRVRKVANQMIRLASDLKPATLRAHVETGSDQQLALVRLASTITKAFDRRDKA